MSVAIRVEGLSKRYRLGNIRPAYHSVRDLFRRRGHTPGLREDFWALHDVSFQVQEGQSFGLIGRNGAGKSTLLRILSRITAPSAGRAEVHGRIGTLLEVGTGFHPELSGRDNIYLNGALLGMSRVEIASRFDEIVAFAGVERFVDTPVKWYSSGMHLRLAFAVAAFLDAEILFVDEVLAVGDAEFQRRCLGRMNDVVHQGRTVVFVSHNLQAMRALCSAGILLDGGAVVASGPIATVVDRYLLSLQSPPSADWVALPPPADPTGVHMTAAAVTSGGVPVSRIMMGDPLTVSVRFRSEGSIRSVGYGVVLHGPNGERLLNANNVYQAKADLPVRCAAGVADCHLGVVPLMAGSYRLSLFVGDRVDDSHVVAEALAFDVLEHDLWGGGFTPPRDASAVWTISGCADHMLERIHPTDPSWVLDAPEHLARYSFAASLVRGGQVLDAGCGVGYGTGVLAAMGAASVIGVDRSGPAIASFGASVTGPAAFVVADVHRLPFDTAAFDAVVCLEVIEHLDDPARFLLDVRRVLRPGGVFVCSTPDKATSPQHDGRPANPFHVQEWMVEEFIALLRGSFPQLTMWTQVESPTIAARRQSIEDLQRITATVNRIRRWFGRSDLAAPTTLGVAQTTEFPIHPFSVAPLFGTPICHVAVCRADS